MSEQANTQPPEVQPAPSDADIIAEWHRHVKRGFPDAVFCTARALLARYGSAAQSGEPVAWRHRHAPDPVYGHGPWTYTASRVENPAPGIEQQPLYLAAAHCSVLQTAPSDEARDAARYRWLRDRPIDTIHRGGVFAGKTPDNVVLNGEDLDAAVDAAIARTGVKP